MNVQVTNQMEPWGLYVSLWLEYQDVYTVVVDMEKLLQDEEVHPGLAEWFVSVCWGIWKERNVICTGGRGKPSRVTLKTSLGLMDEF